MVKNHEEPMTPEEYFSAKNDRISNSKVGDFLKSKEFYKARHIDRTEIFEPTPSMQIGSMVDLAFSEGSVDVLHKKFSVKVLKKDNEVLFQEQKLMPPEMLVTETAMQKALEMSEAVLREPFYAWYGSIKTERQTPLLGELVDNGLTIPICGLPDIVSDDGETIYIDDLKTAKGSALRSPEAWYWHCLEFGYLRQLAIYRFLIQQRNPGRKVVCRHVAVSNQKNGRYAVRLFLIPDALLVPAFYEFGTTAIAIMNERDWKDAPIGWEQAVSLQEPPRRDAPAEEEDDEDEKDPA